ncbi:MAG: hypothetical protein BGO49_17265 [Planctomycetales bacterium 71-10]|nr:MAG: hypothetical protein BGO49_17265 [Planctomycetales bacterium 71-10]
MAGERFEQHVLDRLSDLGEVTSRPPFEGHGLYWQGTIFAIAYAGRLYFKVGEESRGDDLARSMGPFRPNQWQTIKSCYKVPPEMLADPEAMLSWVREAIRAGMTAMDPA